MGGMSEVKMRQPFPESVGFHGAPQQQYPHQQLHQRPRHPIPETARASRTRLTVWSWIALGYSVLNIGASVFATVLVITLMFGGVLATLFFGDAGLLGALVALVLTLLWAVSVPAAGVVGMICAIRAKRLHRQIAPAGHSAMMPIVVGWAAFGISVIIVISVVARFVQVIINSL